MNILADSNIVFAKEAFSGLGSVSLAGGRDITHDRLSGVDALLVRSITHVDKELLHDTPVRFVASATIGTDHVDRDYLRENSIGFAHAPGSNANSVAEYIVACLVLLAEKNGLSLSKMTMGIIGVGNVGSRVNTLAQALGMRCLLNDPPKKVLTGSDVYLPLQTVLHESDIVTVHVPLNTKGPDATLHMVNNDFFSAMKKGGIFINTCRGDVADEASLRQNRKKLGGVALDVWNNEPKPNASTIAACDIATPHIAGYSFDGKACGTKMIYDAMCAYFFKEQTWRVPASPEDRKRIPCDAVDKGDQVCSVVSEAYPVAKDDGRFRKILDVETDKRGEFFDELRRTYPKRLEFGNFAVQAGKKCPDGALSVLVNLGFMVAP
jgi:erythronate-4-phosphate dehydrogenase